MCSKPYICPLFPYYNVQVLIGIVAFLYMALLWMRWLRSRTRIGLDMHIEKLHSMKTGRILFLCSLLTLPALLAPSFEFLIPSVTLQSTPESVLGILGGFILVDTVLSLVALVFGTAAFFKQLAQRRYVPYIPEPNVLFTNLPNQQPPDESADTTMPKEIKQ